ncbi:unnamed protein product [Kuraishia capsulata CBS 1993]|uniref:Autophagy-related protein 29 n=1 Tax=Kuraishia capsulata CBS 1993 TaxID=1382522 RepID=W6MLK0_9ASCO|nr:uncharacterized protein KUCA_T00001677001 [Kuraishia capsulata CBS 1993]CDK25707.1 unnamed protein product [Kuraishia capsulata CBS 1993]
MSQNQGDRAVVYLKFPIARPDGWNAVDKEDALNQNPGINREETQKWNEEKEGILLRSVLPLVKVEIGPSQKKTLKVKYDWVRLSRELDVDVPSLQKKVMELYYLESKLQNEDAMLNSKSNDQTVGDLANSQRVPDVKLDSRSNSQLDPAFQEAIKKLTILDTSGYASGNTSGHTSGHTSEHDNKYANEHIKDHTKEHVSFTRNEVKPLRNMSGRFVSGARQVSTSTLRDSVGSVDSLASFEDKDTMATSKFLHRSLLFPKVRNRPNSDDEDEEEDEEEDEDDLEFTEGSETGISSISQSALENELINRM